MTVPTDKNMYVCGRTFQHQDTTKYLKNRLVLGDMIWLLLHNLITYSIFESPQEYYFNNNVGSNLKIPIGFKPMLLKNSPTDKKYVLIS